MEQIDHTAYITGPFGTCEHIPYPKPDVNLAARQRAALEMSLGTWLITAPQYHPMWSQYCLSLVTLGDHPDLPPAIHKFVGSTHELLVLAINPQFRQTADTMQAHLRKGTLPFLTPVNIAEQFECSDDEARSLAWLAGYGVAHGQLNPETSGAPSQIRESWLASMTKTLAHLRGEAHAS